jgi:hypothetical protein
MIAGLLKMMPFLEKLDPETVDLLVAFGTRAVQSGDVNGYVKRHLKKIVETTQFVEVEVTDVTPKPGHPDAVRKR